MKKPRVVTGSPSVELSRKEFVLRFHQRHEDPTFREVNRPLAAVAEVAWRNYIEYHKSPNTRKAGEAFFRPGYELPREWLDTRRRIQEAERTQRRKNGRSRILLINGSPRSSQTCSGEVSKTYRLAKIAQRAIESAPRFEVDFLDLSKLASEYGRVIYPCKACVSTAQPLCHWPCSCYPNHAMGQTQDWMNEIYPRWAAAHGVMIVTPVNELVPRAIGAQAHDRPPGLRRRRQSGSDHHQGQDSGAGEGHRAEGLGLPQAPRWPCVCRGGAR